MSDLEERLRGSMRASVDSVTVSRGLEDVVMRRAAVRLRRRRVGLSAAIVTAVVALVGTALLVTSDDEPDSRRLRAVTAPNPDPSDTTVATTETTSPVPTTAPALASDAWRHFGPVPLVDDAIAVGTESGVLLWGALNESSSGAGVGWYVGRDGAVSEIPPGPPNAGRRGAVGVWTGRELLIWGGVSVGGELGDGVAYSPAAQSWRAIPSGPLSPRQNAAAVWTGTEMVVWGGAGPGVTYGDGAAYDPVTDDWRIVAASPLRPRSSHTAVWTGSEMVILGGFPAAEDEPGGPAPEGGAYSPANDAWRQLPASGPRPLAWHAAVWTGEEVLVVECGREGPDGLAYRPDTNTWRAVSESPLSARWLTAYAWTGRELVVWGGVDHSEGPRRLTDGAALDPTTARWRRLPDSGLRGAINPAAAWTGSEVVIVAGDEVAVGETDGRIGLYRP